VIDRFSNFIAFRYLRIDRKNRFLSWISGLSVIGVIISVAAMIVVLSVINGFEVELRKRFLHANAHILMFKYPSGMLNPDKWAATIENDYGKFITGISPFVHSETMIRRNSIINGVLVRGMNPEQREKVQSIRHLIRPPEALNALTLESQIFEKTNKLPARPAIIIGSGLAKMLSVKVGQQVQLLSPSESSISDMKSFTVVGLYDSGLKHYDNKLAAVSLPIAQDFFSMGERVTGVELGLHDPEKSTELSFDMETRYGLSVREWKKFNQPLFTAMDQEKKVIGVIVWLIAIVAGFNILMTILVAVTQKQREISILKSLGATHWQVMQIFLKQGVAIGVLGSIGGIVLALVASYILQNYQFIELPDPYFLDKLPVTYSAVTYTWVPISAIIICLLSGFYPSLIAARVPPSEGVQGTGTTGF
jgi:lipoprotein-releasing system permease protein